MNVKVVKKRLGRLLSVIFYSTFPLKDMAEHACSFQKCQKLWRERRCTEANEFKQVSYVNKDGTSCNVYDVDQIKVLKDDKKRERRQATHICYIHSQI